MSLCPISITLLFVYFIITSRFDSTSSTHFTSEISIDCGSTGVFAARNGRKWLGDMQPELSSLLQINGKSTTSTLTNKLALDDPVPFKTARISCSPFSYAFQVDSGQKIIRLHFNPSKYRGFRGLKDLFTVQSGSFTLLSNFSASLTADALHVNTFTKEFCLTIQENQQLIITLSPKTNQLLETYAFINGIEIVSVPAARSYLKSRDAGFQVVGERSMIYVDNDTALEIIQRQNIEQDPVSSNGDLSTVFPRWATQEVEKEKSRNWKIPVNVGFRYLVRLHFSDVGLIIAATGELRFKVLINEKIAQTDGDTSTPSDGNHLLLYRDYIVMMRGLKTDGKRDILISILSYDELRCGHGVLAGFEIVKLSNPDNSLASPNPLPPPQDSQSKSIPYFLSFLGRINANATVAITLISLVNIIVYKLPDIWETCSAEEDFRPSDRAGRLFRHFSLREIQLATEDFHEGYVIGKGGFGKVYRCRVDKGQKTVAVKRLKSNSTQGAHEFLTEIEALSELQHINLISLIGYCRERREMILVYEYMPNGTLGDHLYKNARRNINCTSLTWKQRLNICIGAGRGLDYLHTGHRVIHRDIKASNILLDENFIAKVADFGLAKREDRSRSQTHVSTEVKGTFGYVDPNYRTTKRLTRKSDTYAFGVVLCETLCGRPAVDSRNSQDERVLTMLFRDKISKGEVEDIVDPSLRQEILPDSLKIFVEVAEKCLHDEPKNRPTMSQVVLQLESALEQQENRNSTILNEIAPVASDVCSINEDIKIPSESVEQLADASQNMQTATFSRTKQTNSNYSPATSKDLRKPLMYSPFRAWRAIWRSAKPSTSITQANSRNYDMSNFAAAAKKFTNLSRYFWLHEIKTATHDFDDNFVIGEGASGKVYKGLIDDGATTVAIKRLNPSTLETAREFLTEILNLSMPRHCHLVTLFGYCFEKGEKVLVYNFMAHGTLRDCLHNSRNSPLTWKRRLQICLDAAKGLDYLHTGAGGIIHHKVNSTNILLDEEWVAKIHDFHQLKVRPSGLDDTHFRTTICGSIGYQAPEYFMEQRLTEKSNVYSFGSVLFEVLCARPPVNSELPREQVNLAEWATSCFMEGKLDQIVDSNLNGQIAPKCLNKFVVAAIACFSPLGVDRPDMRDVIIWLETAIKLQEATGIDEEIRLLTFDPSRIAAATDQFSSSHKIGESGSASVYKAVLPTGRKVAVKRFSSSGPGIINQYRNEKFSASSLHHQNIIKLHGYCIHEQRGMHLYEYMENGSLDNFIFDELRRHQLQWSVRFKVIIGITKGVVYLHQVSRPQIIHRDLNASNIFLDDKMNPKISGFGLARHVGDGQSELSTIVAGTLGHSAPEYIVQGIISEKTDVYSFGVLVLEILSGKRINRDAGNFIEYAWKLWKEGIRKVFDLVDETLAGAFSEEEALRCIQVGLLCTQNGPNHRPTMQSVLNMLHGED